MIELVPFSTWCIGIFNGINSDSIPLDNFTTCGALLTAQLMITARKIIKSDPQTISTTGAFIVSSIIVGGLYFTGHSLGNAIKQTIKDKNE